LRVWRAGARWRRFSGDGRSLNSPCRQSRSAGGSGLVSGRSKCFRSQRRPAPMELLSRTASAADAAWAMLPHRSRAEHLAFEPPASAQRTYRHKYYQGGGIRPITVIGPCEGRQRRSPLKLCSRQIAPGCSPRGSRLTASRRSIRSGCLLRPASDPPAISQDERVAERQFDVHGPNVHESRGLDAAAPGRADDSREGYAVGPDLCAHRDCVRSPSLAEIPLSGAVIELEAWWIASPFRSISMAHQRDVPAWPRRLRRQRRRGGSWSFGKAR
jgi:hypothetical protein